MQEQPFLSSAPRNDPYLAAYRLTHDHGRFDEAEAILEDLLARSRQAERAMPFLNRRGNWLLLDIAVHRHHGRTSPCFREPLKSQAVGRIPVFDDTPERSPVDPEDEPGPSRQAA